MEVKDVQPNQGNIDLVLVVTEKGEERTFEKFGKQGRVCSAKAKDDSGEIKLTLWNEDIDKVGVGDKIHLQNGWCSEYQGERQLSSGKFGKIEIVEKGEGEGEAGGAEGAGAKESEGAEEEAGESSEGEEEAGEEQAGEAEEGEKEEEKPAEEPKESPDEGPIQEEEIVE